jgi:hypothetical protein
MPAVLQRIVQECCYICLQIRSPAFLSHEAHKQKEDDEYEEDAKDTIEEATWFPCSASDEEP